MEKSHVLEDPKENGQIQNNLWSMHTGEVVLLVMNQSLFVGDISKKI